MLHRCLIWSLSLSLLFTAVFPMETEAANDTRVADAAKRGERDVVRSLLKQGADVNSAHGDGMTALHWAAMKDDVEMAQMLLYAGANVKATTRLGAVTPLALAARNGYASMVETLLRAGADPNFVMAAGVTPLMLAATAGRADAITALLASGADVNAKEANHGQTPLMFAAAFNRDAAIKVLIEKGADVKMTTKIRTPPPRPNFAALQRGLPPGGAPGQAGPPAGPGQRGAAPGQPGPQGPDQGGGLAAAAAALGMTPEQLTEAAAARGITPDALIAVAAQRGGASPTATANQQDATAPATPGQTPPAAQAALDGAPAGPRGRRGEAPDAPGAPGQDGAPPAQAANAAPAAAPQGAGGQRPAVNREQPGGQGQGQQQGGNNGNDEERNVPPDPMGGMTALLYAARQNSFEAVRALLDSGADVNEVSTGDKSSPLLVAAINGHFDIAMYLLERGADPKLASLSGATPLFGAINVQWAPKALYPQPSTRQEKTTQSELMKALLARGADPNARLSKELWYTSYNFGLNSTNEAGATAFWRASQVGDVEVMRLLVAAGADPKIANNDGVTPLLALSGAGFHGNDEVVAPGGRMPAARYLVDELGADVNAADVGGGGGGGGGFRRAAGGYTAIHNAAARGDNEMILYLVSKGARVDTVSKSGQTTADMANGPRQRIQPFPETMALLMGLGSKNSNKCVSC